MVSAILGIYRVMMELCLPDAQSSIEFTSSNDESNMLFCSAGIKADKKLPDIQDAFTRNSIGNKLYLLSFKRLGDTEPAFMPDFAAVRTACDNLYKLISGGNAISVKAFNTTIRKAINEMSGGELCVVPDGEKTIDDSLFMQGFLIETSPKTVINLPLLGRIAAYYPENKDADGCGEDEINMSALSTPD